MPSQEADPIFHHNASVMRNDPSGVLERIQRGVVLVKSALPLVLGWAAIPAGGIAQEAALPESRPNTSKAESLGDSLLISEAVGKERGEIAAPVAVPVAEPVAAPVAAPVALVEGGRARRRGRWKFESRLAVKGTYDDNIFIRRDKKIADYILKLSPGLAFGFWDSVEARERDLGRLRALTAAVERSRGNFLIFDYSAILMGFAKTTSQNTLDHDARFDTQWKDGKLTLGASVQFESKAESNRDVGGRLRRKTLSAAITSSYQLDPKTTLALAIYSTTNQPEGFARTTEWRGEGTLDYAFTPRARFGFGFAAGTLRIAGGSDQVFERGFVRAGYSLSDKLDVDFRGGVEFRQSDGMSGDRTNPIFNLRATWTPSAGTRVGVSAYRRVETSVEQPEQFIAASGVAVTFLQAMRGGMYLSLEGGYEMADYIGEARMDKYFFVRPGVFWHFADWGTAGVTYEHRYNHSNQRESSFGNNQVSIEFGVKF